MTARRNSHLRRRLIAGRNALETAVFGDVTTDEFVALDRFRFRPLADTLHPPVPRLTVRLAMQQGRPTEARFCWKNVKSPLHNFAEHQ